jgi:tRNA (cytidine/uridine-2'-O-)-methyltransferase
MNLHIALYEPEIPPNTGNIIRLCANTGARLHLIQPLGFSLEDKQLRRAGLDYHEFANLRTYKNYDEFIEALQPRRIFAFSTRGTCSYANVTYEEGDALLFGPETRGLPQTLLDSLPPEHCLRLPMRPDSRSLNLSNVVAVAVYEAWRQLNFAGGR